MRCVVYTMFPLPPYALTSLFGHSIASYYIKQKKTLESNDMSTVYNIPSSSISSRSSLQNNGGRGWVIHLLHLVVEEGGGVQNVSAN